MNIVVTLPPAGPVIQALRSLGYKATTAIADLVDNSIDANSSEISIDFKYSENDGMIIISDNGLGMDEEMLQVAMNIGSKDPRITRLPNELGRFGMGLKTASFSLGKRLSVLTKQNGVYAERCWDLDHVSECNEWQLFMEIPNNVKSLLKDINGENGTIICIDKLDRFIGAGSSNRIHESSFYTKIRRIHSHLEFVFHSLIENGSTQISINGNELVPWDPFMVKHPSTVEGETQILNINGNRIKVKYYILPHASYLNEQEYKRAGGNKGWRDHQGLYIYRENRLLHYGDWLGMFQKDTSSQLARIRIDLPNSADDDWQVDIKKSAVIPPDNAKTRLESISKFVRKISRDIFFFRNKVSHNQQTFKGSLNTWELSGRDDDQQFIINRNHPILLEIQKKINDETSRLLNLYLKFVQLGSPSNIVDSPKVAEETLHVTSDAIKGLVLQFSEALTKLNVVGSLEQLLDALITQPAFDGLNRITLKSILEEANFSYD